MFLSNNTENEGPRMNVVTHSSGLTRTIASPKHTQCLKSDREMTLSGKLAVITFLMYVRFVVVLWIS
jgi:hypothetical protein